MHISIIFTLDMVYCSWSNWSLLLLTDLVKNSVKTKTAKNSRPFFSGNNGYSEFYCLCHIFSLRVTCRSSLLALVIPVIYWKTRIKRTLAWWRGRVTQKRMNQQEGRSEDTKGSLTAWSNSHITIRKNNPSPAQASLPMITTLKRQVCK